MRKNLVIVRAGDHSLHEGWLAGPGERSWDLIVSYFGDDPARFRRDDVRRLDARGGKWPALAAFCRERRDELERYDYVWLPDDDLACDKERINLMFELCHRHGLALAQPALTADSHLSYFITLRNRVFRLRFTNFIETMAPCFGRAAFARCAPTFAESHSGWGLDFVWPMLARDPGRVAIIDAAPVRHTRPVGGPSHRLLAESGISPLDEKHSLLERYGLRWAVPTVLGAIDQQGRRLSIEEGTHIELIDGLVTGYPIEFAHRFDALAALIRPIVRRLGPLPAGAGAQQ